MSKRIRVTPSYPGEALMDIMRREEIDMAFPCSGRQKCAKCIVGVEGAVLPPDKNEASLLAKENLDKGLRLACFVKLEDSAEIYIPKNEWQQIMDKGNVHFEANRPAMQAGSFGAAIDIGTTTIVCTIYGANSSDAIAVISQINNQKRFGADVLSRIQYGTKNGFEILQNVVINQLEDMLTAACSSAGITRKSLTDAVITGNTTMLHLLCGLDASGIGLAPFTTKSLFGINRSDILKGISVYLPSCVSAYVGADLVCSIMASQMAKKENSWLVVDIGTNGEMALYHLGRLICCATAAGPAFEGTSLSHGMLAENGAIAKVEYLPEAGVLYTTIGNKTARGICGSAIVDIVAALLEANALMPSGRLNTKDHPLLAEMDFDPVRYIFPDTNISISQLDIRQVQLAKAAIRGGIEMLLEFGEMNINSLDTIILCGGFGSYLNLDSAERIGLIPSRSKEKTSIIGNGALAGAAMLLLDTDLRPFEQEIAKKCHYIELSSNDRFLELYIDAMNFPLSY